mmetsp:Transcript_114495/g.202948  ORF Transcript_114495/g.202948 Transcript_114495/m.202948 type:complete len:80 (+) Transcript_114495:151-390(+)
MEQDMDQNANMIDPQARRHLRSLAEWLHAGSVVAGRRQLVSTHAVGLVFLLAERSMAQHASVIAPQAHRFLRFLVTGWQ